MIDILLISAYDALSHRIWRQDLATNLPGILPGARVCTVALPDRYFSWRARGNSLTLAAHPDLQRNYDVIIATSMTDLAALRGMNRFIGDTPAIVYFHENQFAFPDRSAEGEIDRQLTTIYTAMAGDRLFFNSTFNQQTFLAGAQHLLDRMPDGVPRDISARLEAKSQVVPVSIDLFEFGSGQSSKAIAWNHRWEHDKGPGNLLQIVDRLIDRNTDFELGLFGQQFRSQPAEMEVLIKRLKGEGRLKHLGFIDNRSDYLRKLSEHRIVLSTTDHEFQGLAVQEGIAVGCIPVVPDAFSYPEYVPAELRYSNPLQAVELIEHILQGEDIPRLSLESYKWENLSPQWLAAIREQVRPD